MQPECFEKAVDNKSKRMACCVSVIAVTREPPFFKLVSQCSMLNGSRIVYIAAWGRIAILWTSFCKKPLRPLLVTRARVSSVEHSLAPTKCLIASTAMTSGSQVDGTPAPQHFSLSLLYSAASPPASSPPEPVSYRRPTREGF